MKYIEEPSGSPEYIKQGLCDHHFVYSGVRYTVSEAKVPGSGAQIVVYYDAFHCSKCLKIGYKELSITGNTYEHVKFNATPLK